MSEPGGVGCESRRHVGDAERGLKLLGHSVQPHHKGVLTKVHKGHAVRGSAWYVSARQASLPVCDAGH